MDEKSDIVLSNHFQKAVDAMFLYKAEQDYSKLPMMEKPELGRYKHVQSPSSPNQNGSPTFIHTWSTKQSLEIIPTSKPKRSIFQNKRLSPNSLISFPENPPQFLDHLPYLPTGSPQKGTTSKKIKRNRHTIDYTGLKVQTSNKPKKRDITPLKLHIKNQNMAFAPRSENTYTPSPTKPATPSPTKPMAFSPRQDMVYTPKQPKLFSPRQAIRRLTLNAVPKMSCKGETRTPGIIYQSIEKASPVLKRNEKLRKSLSIDGWCQSESPALN